MENQQKLEAKYGLFTAISMVIGQVIGSGIFNLSGNLRRNIPTIKSKRNRDKTRRNQYQ